jgi:hypothetical protein
VNLVVIAEVVQPLFYEVARLVREMNVATVDRVVYPRELRRGVGLRRKVNVDSPPGLAYRAGSTDFSG